MANGDRRGPRGIRGKTGRTGRRGQRGKTGRAGVRGLIGPPGPAGPTNTDAVKMIDHFVERLDEVQSDLKVQFTRIAQLQADLDQLRSELRKQR